MAEKTLSLHTIFCCHLGRSIGSTTGNSSSHIWLLRVFQLLPGSSNWWCRYLQGASATHAKDPKLEPHSPNSFALLWGRKHCSHLDATTPVKHKMLFSKIGMKSVIKCENLYIIQKADAGQLLKANSTPQPALVWLEPASGTHPSWGNVHRAGQPSSASCSPPTGAGDNLCTGTFFFYL